MPSSNPCLLAALATGSALALTACGSKSSSPAPPPPPAPPTTTAAALPPQTSASATRSAPGALQAEATSAATGDIPDNQVFLVFHNRAAGYSMKYPEGWAQRGTRSPVTFSDKNNIVRVLIARGGLPDARQARRGISAGLRRAPHTVALPGGRAIALTYASRSAPNAVTGKRVTLVVDRYYLARAGRRAVVDLGTPEGVDNVDAYRLMIESFRWK